MYRFETSDGKKYVAKVQYNEGESLYPIKTPEGEQFATVRLTTVSLGEVLPSGEVDVFSEGTSFCHPNDRFVKAVGRRQAATVAVRMAYDTCSVPGTQEFAKTVLALFPKA